MFRSTPSLPDMIRKSPRWQRVACGVFVAGVVAFNVHDAHAYIGPGAGFALISSFLTVFIAFFTAFFAIITFPVRALIKTMRRRSIIGKAKVKKVVVLGLDGLEPTICERMMDEGQLPNMKRLMEQGTYKRLGTSTPALSPVAWSTFATGVDSSRHAIYDFLDRDKRTYLPTLSSSEVYGGQKFIKIGPFRIPRGKGGVRMLRKARSFWKILSDYGVFCSVLRVPITFPVEKVNGVMVAGMCVPDLRGTQGSFTYFTSEPEADKIGGLIIKVTQSDGWMETAVPGPVNPLDGKTLEIPMKLRAHIDTGEMEMQLAGESYRLRLNEYTDWIRLTFKAAMGIKLRGIVKFRVTRLDGTFGLYMTPIHIDPDKPAMPFTYPAFFSNYLSKLMGPFATLGLAEDTWAMNERVLDERGWLDQAYAFHEERKKMWFHSLKKLRDGMQVCVFDLSDRLQHMFFRYLDEDHPANAGKDTEEFKDTIYQMYRDMDELVGDTMKYVDKDTALFVISDHGFKTFKRGINLNTWLKDQGLLVLKDDAPVHGGEYLNAVDWTKTKAYSIGLGGIFINRKGRERLGFVEEAEFQQLKQQISDGLMQVMDGNTKIMNRMIDVQQTMIGPYNGEGPDLIPGFAEGYRVSWDCAKGTVTRELFEDNTKSWSGDHCMDPDIVPGILYTNMPVSDESPRLMDIGPTVLHLFGVDVPPHMLGKSIVS